MIDSQYLRELFEEEFSDSLFIKLVSFSKEEKEKFLQIKYIEWLEEKVINLDIRLKNTK